MRGRWAALVAVTILASVGGPAVGLGVLHASDTLLVRAPWRDAAPHGFAPVNPAVSDTVDATVPGRAEWSRRARRGDLPLWSDLQAGGAPLAAVPNASAFAPLSAPWYLLPLWLAPAVTKVLEMGVAALFAFLLARRLGLTRPAGALAALAFVNSGFQVVWTNWQQSHVGALLPALFWAVDRLVARRRAVDLVPLALVSAAMWFEGFPAVTLWGHVAAGAYAVARAAAAARRGPSRVAVAVAARRVGLAAAGMALGVAVAAIQLLPFAARLGQVDLGYRADKLLGALPWQALVTMLVPDAFGNPVDGVFYGARNYVELNAFAGAAVLVLLVAGLVAGRRSRVAPEVRGLLFAATLLCLWLVFVGGPLLEAYHRLPVVGPNSIGRLRSLLGLLLALQAAIGLDALLARDTGRHETRRIAAGLLAAGAGFAVLVVSAGDAAARAGRGAYFQERLALPLAAAVVAVTLVVVAGSTTRLRVRRGLAAALVVLVAVEGALFARGFLPRIDRDRFYPVTEVHRFLAAELGHDRLAVDGFTLVPGSTVVYDLRSITAHTLTPEPYADLLTALDPTVFDRNRTYPLLSPLPHLPSSPLLDRMAARFFVADPAMPVTGTGEVVTRTAGTRRLAAGEAVTAPLPPGPLRAVRLDLHEPVDPAAATHLAVEVHDAGGRVLASGRRRVLPRTPAGPFDVALAGVGDVGATGPDWTVEVAVEAAAGGVTLGVSDAGEPALTAVRPADDGLRVALTDGATVYRRERALPRLRWADRAVVEASPRARVRLLGDGGVPPDTVVLSEPPPLDARGGPGGGADLQVVEDSGDVVAVTVDAGADGWLVVADTLQDGWVATVDGRPVPLVDADHAFVAVPVPAGTHEVELGYRPPGWRAGAVVTALAVLLLVGAVALELRRTGRGRPASGHDLQPATRGPGVASSGARGPTFS